MDNKGRSISSTVRLRVSTPEIIPSVRTLVTSCQDPTFSDPPTRAASKTRCPGRQDKALLSSSFSLVLSESWRLRKSMGICTWQQRPPIVDVDGLTSRLLGVPCKILLLSASRYPSSRPCLPGFVPAHSWRVCVSDTPSKRPQNPIIRRGSWRGS